MFSQIVAARPSFVQLICTFCYLPIQNEFEMHFNLFSLLISPFKCETLIYSLNWFINYDMASFRITWKFVFVRSVFQTLDAVRPTSMPPVSINTFSLMCYIWHFKVKYFMAWIVSAVWHILLEDLWSLLWGLSGLKHFKWAYGDLLALCSCLWLNCYLVSKVS